MRWEKKNGFSISNLLTFDHSSFDGLFDNQCLELAPLILNDVSEFFCDLMIALCAFALQRSSAV